MSLLSVRIAASVIALVALAYAVYRREAVVAGLRAFFLTPTAPINLALMRVALFGWLAWVSSDNAILWWAGLPAELRSLPLGWGFLTSVLPINAPLAHSAQMVVVASAACAALGLFTRVTAPIAALSAVYLLGVPSFFGKVLHEDHALVMMVLVLAASPCGDVLSLDRLWRARRGEPLPGPSAAYTLPVRMCWLLLGTIYLFPGIWKVWENGDLWLSGERLLWELHDEWGQRKTLVPPFRIDQHPLLLKLAGAATLIFEVGFFFALFFRKARIVAALSAVGFHVGVRLFLGIKFYELLPLVVLLDLPALGAYKNAAALKRSLTPSAVVGGVLLAGAFYTGLAQVDSWPLALHPKFSERKGSLNTVRNHQIMLETLARCPVREEDPPGPCANAQDMDDVMVKLGARNGFKRILMKLDRELAKGTPRQAKSRAVVQMLRDNGLPLVAGDRIVIYKTRWSVFPLGERKNWKRTFMRRYEVQADGELKLVKNANKKD